MSRGVFNTTKLYKKGAQGSKVPEHLKMRDLYSFYLLTAFAFLVWSVMVMMIATTRRAAAVKNEDV